MWSEANRSTKQPYYSTKMNMEEGPSLKNCKTNNSQLKKQVNIRNLKNKTP